MYGKLWENCIVASVCMLFPDTVCVIYRCRDKQFSFYDAIVENLNETLMAG